MLRPFLLAARIAPALPAQTPEQRFKEAWSRYAHFDLAGDAGKEIPTGLPSALDDLGSAWAAWAEAQGPAALKLPALVASDPAPATQILGQRGQWILLGLEVPVPCGSHLFLSLFKEEKSRWKLTMLDLHESRSQADLLGARENVQTLLLDGPKVVVASTPPWCTSCWGLLRVRIEAPGTDAQHPAAMAHFEDTVYRCAEEDMLKMTPMKGGVRLRYEGAAHQGGAIRARQKMLRF